MHNTAHARQLYIITIVHSNTHNVTYLNLVRNWTTVNVWDLWDGDLWERFTKEAGERVVAGDVTWFPQSMNQIILFSSLATSKANILLFSSSMQCFRAMSAIINTVQSRTAFGQNHIMFN